MKKIHIFLTILLSLGLLNACQTWNNIETPTEPSAVPQQKATATTHPTESSPTDPIPVPLEPLPSIKMGTPSPAAQIMIELSREDLSKRLMLTPDEITLKAVEATTWPDTSLGCSQPNMAYAQKLTKGFVILLKVKTDVFLYHTDETNTVVFCPKPEELPEFPLTPSDIKDGKPWLPVD